MRDRVDLVSSCRRRKVIKMCAVNHSRLDFTAAEQTINPIKKGIFLDLTTNATNEQKITKTTNKLLTKNDHNLSYTIIFLN